MRQAIIDGECPKECLKTEQEKGYCICITDNPDTLTNEVLEKNLSNDKLYKIILCDKTNVKYILATEATPNGCVDIAKVLSKKDHKYIDTELVHTLQSLCCAACPGEGCFVKPSNWGKCPRCISDNSCAQACIE